MKKWACGFGILTIVAGGNIARANCPSGYPNEIFCDDFDTYCATGGYPGDPHCAPTDNSVNNVHLREVWTRTSTSGAAGPLCGVEVKVEDAQSLINSAPLGVRSPKGDLGQSTVRDWTEAGSVLDIHRLIGNAFGSQYAAVAGTDNAPLSMEFFMAADVGKLFLGSSYLELAYGPPSDPANRANTDYALSPNCNTYCSPGIQQLPYPIICAQGSPMSALNPPLVPVGCPPKETAPIRNAIAVGQISQTDPNPCHCGNTEQHHPQNTHLTLFDGQLWWVLRTNNPVASTGTVTPRDNAPANPSDLVAGDFVLSSPPSGTKSYNLVRVTIKATTIRVELTSRLKSSNGFQYDVYNVMDDIPRQYTGPFDRISMGVGPGCELANNTDWDTCKAGTDRACILYRDPFNWFVDFDDFVLFGGVGHAISGACCHSDGTCTVELPENCQAPGDIHGGSNTDCSTTACCAHDTYVWADSDGDGDVDVDDFGQFQRCFTGPNGPLPADLKCECFNRHGSDNDIDDDDFLQFTNCVTGANVPWAPGSPASCVP